MEVWPDAGSVSGCVCGFFPLSKSSSAVLQGPASSEQLLGTRAALHKSLTCAVCHQQRVLEGSREPTAAALLQEQRELESSILGLGPCLQKGQGCSNVLCKDAGLLQRQSSADPTCRGGPDITTPSQSPVICVEGSEDSEGLGQGDRGVHSHCHTRCRDSFLGHRFQDPFAAYCHPLPLPSPAQLLPYVPGLDRGCCPPHPSPSSLSFPRLISSISETGLDSHWLRQCCPDLGASGQGTPVPYPLPCPFPAPSSSSYHYSCPLQEGGCHYRAGGRSTRDVGTMTSAGDLPSPWQQDTGVQTGESDFTYLFHASHRDHVYPQVSLNQQQGSEKGRSPGNRQDQCSGQDSGQRSPVKEVAWDAEGMTWEVYGASVDPEVLGLAIQKHLELQIQEAAGRTSRLSRQNTQASQCSQHSQHSQQRRKWGSSRGGRGVMALLRNPGCCTRSNTAAD
ncbi:G protein-regulated inducer of neurite outgrowth 2 [Huso huso]|uniref:G protein-regulated inducer of neurite outgrowth 2 n=1 Tax=Huso huso TaxID=61971 RepID=A0ABR0ZRH7_HUSHU